MRKLKQGLVLAGIAVVLGAGAGNLAAQERPGRGNFDPEQMRQRMMERYREQLEVKGEDEWKIISDRIGKVMDARREVGFGGFGSFGRGRGGDGGGGGGGRGGDTNSPPRSGDDQARRSSRGGGFGGEPSPEAEALQKAIEAKAPAAEVKAKLAKVREARKEKEAKLEKAQAELAKVLSVNQEASAVLMGLLK